MKKRENIMIVVCVGAVIFTLIGLIFAYYQVAISNANRQEVTIEAGTLALSFYDNDPSIETLSGALKFDRGEITKRFLIENTGSESAYATISWENLVNTYTSGSLVYTLTQIDESNNETILVENKNVPVGTRDKVTLKENILIPADTTDNSFVYEYILTIKLISLDNINQTSDFNASFSSYFTLGEGNDGTGRTLATNLEYNNELSTNNCSTPQCAIDEIYNLLRED